MSEDTRAITDRLDILIKLMAVMAGCLAVNVPPIPGKEFLKVLNECADLAEAFELAKKQGMH